MPRVFVYITFQIKGASSTVNPALAGLKGKFGTIQKVLIVEK